jgi:hypothetical protein
MVGSVTFFQAIIQLAEKNARNVVMSTEKGSAASAGAEAMTNDN